MRRGKRRGRRSNRLGMFCITAVVALLLVALSVQSYALAQKNKAYAQEEELLNKELADEQKRSEEIEEFEDYVQTDEYVEKAARDKLGMVYPDEILIRPEK